MDFFPTLLKIAGGNPGDYRLDGLDIMPMLTERAPSPHGTIFWEMDKQTAVRKGKYKLVLNGVLVEEEPPGEELFLADLGEDPGERNNLAAEFPRIAGELRAEAEEWRAALEKHWTAKKERPL
jgi:arylsulfatase A-like enzyme